MFVEGKGSAKLTLYVDPASQPSRSVLDFVRRTEIPFEIKETVIAKFENRGKDFRAIFPTMCVPGIRDISSEGQKFHMSESGSIMKYLATTRNVADHWYPAEPRKRAVVDAYLDWHHTYLRVGTGQLVFRAIFLPLVFNKTMSDKALEFNWIRLYQSCKQMEEMINQNGGYLCSD